MVNQMEEIAKLVFILTVFFADIITIYLCVSTKYPSKKIGGDWLNAWLERLKKIRKIKRYK